jgi:hypothetical protein
VDPVIGVNDPAGFRATVLDRHVERVDDEGTVLAGVDGQPMMRG